MTHADRLLRTPGVFRRLTGLTPVAFHRLRADVARAREAADAKRANRPGRRRQPGGGRKPALGPDDQLLLALVYYRIYVPFAVVGFLFGIDASTACRTVRRIEPLLAGVFRIPERKVTIGEDELKDIFFDATERPTNRPTRRQRRHYSGKKKRHTIKTQVVVVPKKKKPGPGRKPRRLRIAAVSPSFPGKTHDKKAFDRTGAEVPAGATGYGDTAYKGTPLATPAKRPPKGKLTGRQRRGNRRLGRKRVVVEHAIGKLKTWRIAAEKYRNRRSRHTLVMKNVAGLHNLMYA